MKDIVFIDTGSVNSNKNWEKLVTKYPHSRRLRVTNTQLEHVIEKAKANTFTSAFWIVYDDIAIIPTMFDFSYETTEWDEQYVHVWRYLHNFKPSIGGIYHVTRKHSVPLQFKPMKPLAGYVNNKAPSKFDIFFISYFEPNADENWERLKTRYPRATRINGVKGIHNAHLQAAELSTTDMFWVIDADAVLLDDFHLTYRVLPWDMDNVYVWRSMNPINELVYGYGGVKLLPKHKTLSMDIGSIDMTTSISQKFFAVSAVSNLTNFNTDAFNTWKSAFRECVKLSSKVITNQKSNETISRLNAWCTLGAEKTYGKECIAGALAGREFGTLHKDNSELLKSINDFGWLHEQFSKYTME